MKIKPTDITVTFVETTGDTMTGNLDIEFAGTSASDIPTLRLSNPKTTTPANTTECHFDMLSGGYLCRLFYRAVSMSFGYYIDFADGNGPKTRIRISPAGVNIETIPLTVDGVPVMVGEDSGWVSLTLLNSWANLGSTYATAACRKLGKFVTLRGSISSGTTTNGTVVCVLPEGFRPPADLQMAIATTSTAAQARLLVRANGNVQIYDVNVASLGLDGFSFFID